MQYHSSRTRCTHPPLLLVFNTGVPSKLYTASTPYTHTYAYSAIGNITSASDLGSYTYAETGYANPHAVTSVNGQTYTYDNAGNVTADGTRTNTWDYRNQLSQTTKVSTTYRYLYDQGGQRTAYYDGSATTTYPNKYYDQKGSTKTKHLYAGDVLVASIEGNGTATTTNTIHADHLGGTNVVTNASGTVTQTLSYYPFGASRVDEKTGGFDESRKFTGHEYDDATALYYMNARYQNPSTGRFVSQDPAFWALPNALLANPQKQNSYTYADNNPVTMVDPTGMLTSPQTSALASAFGSGKIKDVAGVTKMLLSYAASNVKAGASKVVNSITNSIKNTAASINDARPAVGAAIGEATENPFQGLWTIIDPNSTIAERIGATFGVGLSAYPGKGGGKVPSRNLKNTLEQIRSGGTLPYKQDGTIFYNREGLLPEGNYKEYTVETPGLNNRGEKRVVQNTDTGETYYTDDHYKSFTKITGD